jgi:hypothetical protein
VTPPRDESEHERLDRNLVELLQELRVAQAGVQILFAFLLTIPFSQRFKEVGATGRGVYLATVVASAGAIVFLIAPVAYHRIVFRQNEKRQLVLDSSKLALAGLICLALAMLGALFLVTDFLFHALTVALVVGGVGLGFVLFWIVLPLIRRSDDIKG